MPKSFLQEYPGQLRLPDFRPLPDGRWQLADYRQFPAPVWATFTYGSLHPFDGDVPADEQLRWGGLRLILVEPGIVPNKPSLPSLIYRYEQIHATAETQVGKLTRTIDNNGRETIEAQFIQFSAGTYTAGAVGVTTPPGVATAVMDSASAVDEGILRKITRRYTEAGATFVQVGPDVYDRTLNGLLRVRRRLVAKGGTALPAMVVGTTAGPDNTILGEFTTEGSTTAVALLTQTFLQAGVLSEAESESSNGALKQFTRQVFGTVAGANALAGYVLIGTSEDNIEGYPTTRYTFAKGIGLVSRQDSDSNNGALLSATLRYLTAPLAADPIASLAGYVRVSNSKQEADGHVIWSATFAKGIGLVSRQDSDSNNGKLLSATLRYLTAPLAADPIASLAGYVRVSNSKQEADGHIVWTATFAKGIGEVSRQDSDSNNGALLSATLRYLTAPGAADPIASLAGYVRVSNSKQEADGHIVWTATFAKGIGLVRISESAGPVPGTTRVTHVSLGPAPINDANASIPTGVLIDKDNIEEDGYVRYVRTCVAGTILGVKQTYKDVVDVPVPGTVELTTVAVAAGALSGTLAVEKVTPTTTKSIAATVTVEIVNTPPNTATVAYDLGAISCSVLSTQASYNYEGFDRMATIGGTVTVTAERRGAAIGADIRFYPRHYLINTSATGTFTFTSGSVLSRSSGGSIVTATPQTSTKTNTLTGTGATSAVGYTTTGVVQRKSRPVFNTLAGVTYYEVITWTV